jgi:hypothetical protein
MRILNLRSHLRAKGHAGVEGDQADQKPSLQNWIKFRQTFAADAFRLILLKPVIALEAN